ILYSGDAAADRQKGGYVAARQRQIDDLLRVEGLKLFGRYGVDQGSGASHLYCFRRCAHLQRIRTADTLSGRKLHLGFKTLEPRRTDAHRVGTDAQKVELKISTAGGLR